MYELLYEDNSFMAEKSRGPTALQRLCAKALELAPAGEWRSQPTRDGLRAIRLMALSAPRAADFDSLRGVVLQDWTDAVLAEQRTAAVRALAKKYTVKFAVASK